MKENVPGAHSHVRTVLGSMKVTSFEKHLEISLSPVTRERQQISFGCRNLGIIRQVPSLYGDMLNIHQGSMAMHSINLLGFYKIRGVGS